MSRDKIKGKITPKQDTGWESLISASESQIEDCRKKITLLRKSLIFFKKQRDTGIQFPVDKMSRHKEIS
jgi:hypothetical protein